MVGKSNAIFCTLIFLFLNGLLFSQATKPDPFKSDYVKYIPDFISKIKPRNNRSPWFYTKKQMELSSEKKYYTLSEIEEVNRANALVKAALENEKRGDYRKAMTMYQKIIRKFNKSQGYKEVLFRVSDYGVFVPVAQYCQRRLLNFPAEHLNFYRTLHDAEAKELYIEAVRKYSVELFSEIIDKYLATSFGGKSLQFLGDAALDRGNFLEALEYYQTILKNIPDAKLRTPELKLKIELCQKSIGVKGKGIASKGKSLLKSTDLNKLSGLVKNVKYIKPKVTTQKNSRNYMGADDYSQSVPTKDMLGLELPEWESSLVNARNDYYVFAQPVITDTSVLFRHKNIIYCYSIINGELRWKNNLGGRAVWQSWRERQYPIEDIVVNDGVVVTPIIKGGSSLIALDEITGQLKWSHGPMAVSEGDESKMRFECAPTSGPGTIYANYVLDNIKGSTHIDSEYGIIAYDSVTGRMKWRRQICRLMPGKFDGGFGVARRNRIRSFFSPPLYHQGTIYTCTNSGVIAALNSVSGRIKWLFRYPYHQSIHDLTRSFGNFHKGDTSGKSMTTQRPSFWMNQRPMVIGDSLYITSVDSPFLFSIDRKTGKINWTYTKKTPTFEYFLGAISTGELVVAGSGRNVWVSWQKKRKYHPVYLLDPKTGKTTWKAPDYIPIETQPVMTIDYGYQTPTHFNMNNKYFALAARPFLTNKDTINMTSWTNYSIWWRKGMYAFALGEIDLKQRKVLKGRRYYNGMLLAHADWIINSESTGYMRVALKPFTKGLKEIPRKNKKINAQIKAFEKILADTVPVNKHPAFMPFIRMTFKRYGVQFELRLTPRKLSMNYNRKKFDELNKPKTDLNSVFGKAEMAKKDGDFDTAAKLLGDCLTMVSPEDVNFRALLKQQFYKVYLELVRSSIRGKFAKEQLKNTIGMSNTASVLAEEVETLFALAEAYQKNGNFKSAASCLRNLIEIYGEHEYPISDIAKKTVFEKKRTLKLKKTLNEIYDNSKNNSNDIYLNLLVDSLNLNLNSFDLYSSAVSPLPKDISLRTGDLAIRKLVTMLSEAGDYNIEYKKYAEIDLKSENVNQLLYHIWKYPGSEIGQSKFDKIFELSKKLSKEDRRLILLKLKHVGNLCEFKIPNSEKHFYEVPMYNHYKSVNSSAGSKEFSIENYKDGIMMLMERNGDRSIKTNYIFLSIRLPKRIGNKFSVLCFDVNTGKEVWRKNEFRLKGLGKEPGFYKAFVQGNIVVINGMSDVYGFELNTGKEIWHYKTPDSFEVLKSLVNGNLFYICSDNETIALQVNTKSPVGEVAWHKKEEGRIYSEPYFIGENFISIRKYPFNITSRFRTTGSLVYRMSIPDLMLIEKHPFVKKATKIISASTFENLLVVTDGWYVLVYDVRDMKMLWKTLIESKDWSNETGIRFVINDKYLVLTKMDYDQKIMYCYNMKTGQLNWKTDYKIGSSPRPLYSLTLDGNKLYGLEEYSGQGFYFTAYECDKGKRLFKNLYKGYSEKPFVEMDSISYGNNYFVKIQDRKNFEILLVDKKSGKPIKKIKSKGDGPIGAPGKISMIMQNGHPVLFSKNKFKY
ncbi:MAG: hypothetical protein COA79_13830 [Planctomycetota bacterium]|nr:MAG: hypothetical protein COA79_13830 [Planctomycetota bacterium]